MTQRLMLAVILGWTVGGYLAAEDAVIIAAEAALADRRPAMALALISDRSLDEVGPALAIAIRVAAMTGDWQAALTLTGDWQRWPPAIRGELAWSIGQALIAVHQWDAARPVLLIAVDSADSFSWDALDALAEVAYMQGDVAYAKQCADIHWRRIPRVAAAAPAGILLARMADNNAERQRLVTQITAIPHVAPAHAEMAWDILLQSLLQRDPAGCIIAAQTAQQAGFTSLGAIMEAAALVYLEPASAREKITKLPDKDRQNTVIQRAVHSLQQIAPVDDRDRRLGMARVAAANHQWATVASLVQPLAAADIQAFQLLIQVPNVDVGLWQDVPVAQTPQGACVLAQYWVNHQKPQAALQILEPQLAGRDPQVCYWAWRAGRELSDQRVDSWLEVVCVSGDVNWQVGEAWAARAPRLSTRAQTVQAWARAAQFLDPHHGWFLPALENVLRGELQGETTDKTALMSADRLIDDDQSEAAQRCHFFAATLAQQAGDSIRLERHIGVLWPLAGEQRRAKLQQLRESK